MTWNLRIGRAWPGETAEQTAERLGNEEQEEVAPDPAEIRRMGKLLAALAPSLTLQEAPKGWVLAHGGSGAQIRMSGDEFSMTVPRVFSPSMARGVWTELWPALRALDAEGYHVYASPLGRVLQVDSDFDEVVTKYGGAAPATAAAPPQPSKPWWQFWR